MVELHLKMLSSTKEKIETADEGSERWNMSQEIIVYQNSEII